MLLTTISDKEEIKKYQQQFQEKLIAESNRRVNCFAGYQGGSSRVEAFWFDKAGYWASFHELENRYWNAFGVTQPVEGSNLSITCELNFPLRGINPQIAGAFGKTDSGQIYIIHRGIIGGGRPGICRELFIKGYKGRWVNLDDLHQESRVALVSELGSPDLVDNITDLIKQIHRIKEDHSDIGL